MFEPFIFSLRDQARALALLATLLLVLLVGTDAVIEQARTTLHVID